MLAQACYPSIVLTAEHVIFAGPRLRGDASIGFVEVAEKKWFTENFVIGPDGDAPVWLSGAECS